MSEHLQKIREIVADTFDVGIDDVTAESSADDIDGWDSLAHATLVLRLERVFNIELPPGGAAAAQNLGELAELTAASIAAGAGPPKAGTVFVGTDGTTLFHRDHDTVEQLTGQLQFTPSELDHWVSCIETRHAWCAARGIAYIHLVVPEKHVVYEDLVPFGMKPSSDRPVTRLFRAVSGPARASMLYPLALLQSRRSVRETFLANDTHWTMYGGFIVYEALMQAAARHIPLSPMTEADIYFTEQRHVGDLGARMQPEQPVMAPVAQHRTPMPFRVIYENKTFARGNVTVYEGPDRTKPRAILFRDSFSNYLVPHMIQCFSRLTVVGSPHVFYDLIRAEKPDIVFYQIIERFMAFKIGPGEEKLLPGDLTNMDSTTFLGISPDDLAQTT